MFRNDMFQYGIELSRMDERFRHGADISIIITVSDGDSIFSKVMLGSTCVFEYPTQKQNAYTLSIYVSLASRGVKRSSLLRLGQIYTTALPS